MIDRSEKRLSAYGFRPAGKVVLRLDFAVSYEREGTTYPSAVYAFSHFGEIKYFGQTASDLQARLAHLTSTIRRDAARGALNAKCAIFFEALQRGPLSVWAKRPERTHIHGVECELLEAEEIVLMRLLQTDWNDRGQLRRSCPGWWCSSRAVASPLA